MKYQVDGEFGAEEVEAETLHDAAVQTARAHAGLDCDEICREPFWFTVAPVEFPDNAREFQAEWNSEDGLEVFDMSSGEYIGG